MRDKSNAADFLTKWVSATKIKESVAYTSNKAAKKNITIHEEVSSLEVSVVEIRNHTMELRRGRLKVAQISRERPPLPNEGGFLAYFWGQEHRIEDLFAEPPPAAPPPITALPPIGAQAVERAASTLMAAYLAAGSSAAGAGGPSIADMVASFVSTIREAATSAVAEAAPAESPVYSDSEMEVEEEEEPKAAHVHTWSPSRTSSRATSPRTACTEPSTATRTPTTRSSNPFKGLAGVSAGRTRSQCPCRSLTRPTRPCSRGTASTSTTTRRRAQETSEASIKSRTKAKGAANGTGLRQWGVHACGGSKLHYAQEITCGG